VSLHERFSIARRNVGFPHWIVYLLSYPSSLLPSSETLSSRIQDLQKHFPLLYSEIINGQTRNPAFQLREPWSSPDILTNINYLSKNVENEEKAILLKSEIDRVQSKTNIIKPLWQVVRYTPSSDGEDRSYLALSVDHTLTDGRGGILLLQALLAESIDDLPYEQLDTIPRLDDTHNLKPSISYLIPMIFQELLVPKLPSFLQKYVKPYPIWPSGNVQNNPIDCEGQLSITTISPEILSALKKVGKENGVATLHPIFEISIWSCYLDGTW